MKETAVVILNWNGLNYLQTFLPKVLEYSKELADVWVIDNASTDDSMAYLATLEEVKTLQLDINYGFSKGYNMGLAQIEAKHYVLLNSDVEVTQNWLAPVLDFMKEANLAACQPKVLSYHQKDHFEYAGATGGFMDCDGFVFCAGRIFDTHEKDLGQYNENKEVFWASGAALFVRSEVYHECGGLDEDFFAHMEEIDLCWRMKNRGYKIGACGRAIVYHVGGGTLNKINPFKTYLNFRNNLYMFLKNEFTKPIFFALLKRMVLDGIAGTRFLFEGNFSYTLAVLKAHFSFYRNLPLMCKKRKVEKAARNHPNRTGLYQSSILIAYFAKGKKFFSQLDQNDFIQAQKKDEHL
ncbi:MAG: glycosyltransferase family 2 protein [Flavobacteriaceae bacterium]|nr:glycosyltransferase family 2 protein [Flavobacteriaceae bacterium]